MENHVPTPSVLSTVAVALLLVASSLTLLPPPAAGRHAHRWTHHAHHLSQLRHRRRPA